MSASPPTWRPLPEEFRDYAAAHRGSVLLETAKGDAENFRSFLFADALSRLVAHTADEVEAALGQIDAATARGQYVAGFAAYECGEAFAGLAPRGDGTVPLLDMGVFRAPVVFDHRDGSIDGEFPQSCAQGPAESAVAFADGMEIDAATYADRVARVQSYLAAGHTYQVNLTTRVTGRAYGAPVALYRKLLQRQPVAYAAFLNCGERQVLSLSPELFYRVSGDTIAVRPMKGTWPLGDDEAQAAGALLGDRKNRAEHTTIVDLLRNDLGKVAVLGSVHVDRLMQIERYPTLLQMTSSISATLAPETTPSEIFCALFPSGSITGAPKRRTMEIIRELEDGPRGIYTGAIGYFGPGREACFSVAIRTLVVERERFTLGVGGGITVDSVAEDELAECRLKASFLAAASEGFHLIETMRAEAGEVLSLAEHLERMRRSARFFGIPFDEATIRAAIPAPDEPSRLRLALDRAGTPQVQITPLEASAWGGKLLLSSQRTDAGDLFLAHKTSERALYDRSFREARSRGFDEVLFANGEGMLTEGCIGNLVLRIGGRLVTPALASGVLPGIGRAHLLAEGAESRPVALQELALADAIWTCSALRGMRPARTVETETGERLWTAQK